MINEQMSIVKETTYNLHLSHFHKTVNFWSRCYSTQIMRRKLNEKTKIVKLLLNQYHRSSNIVCLDSDYDDDGSETFKRYKPRSLNELVNLTKFSKKEIQLIYQGFKQECPSGMKYILKLYRKKNFIFIQVLLMKKHLKIFMDNFFPLLMYRYTHILSLQHLIYIHPVV